MNRIKNVRDLYRLMRAAQKGQKIRTLEDGSYEITINKKTL